MPHAKYNSYLKSVSNDRLQSQAVMPHVQDIPQALIWQSSEARGAELVWQTVPFSKPRILALVTRRHGHLQRDLYAGYHYRTYGASVRNTMIQRKRWTSQGTVCVSAPLRRAWSCTSTSRRKGSGRW